MPRTIVTYRPSLAVDSGPTPSSPNVPNRVTWAENDNLCTEAAPLLIYNGSRFASTQAQYVPDLSTWLFHVVKVLTQIYKTTQ
jgi:hypothetical protein